MQNEFPNARDVCWLNTAAEGLLPRRAVRAMEQAAHGKQRPQHLGDPENFHLPRRCRVLLAELLHCTEQEIALVPSTSFGFATLALSLPLQPGDEVLLVERDFPSNNFQWETLRRNGIHVRTVPFLADEQQTSRVLESISPATRVVSLSLVHFYTGYRYDLPLLSERCSRDGIFLILDAMQAAGAIEINLQQTHVDAICCAGHKWQLAPQGTGFLYIRNELLPQLKPIYSSWMYNADAVSYATGDLFAYKPCTDARRFELGSTPYSLLAAYEQCLLLLKESRIPYIESHNRRLIASLNRFFTEIGWALPAFVPSASIYSVVPPEPYEADNLLARLEEKQVYVAVRENHFRISPHFYNTEQDIQRFCNEFRKLLQ